MKRKSKIKALAVGVFALGIALSIVFATLQMLPGVDNRQWTVLGAQIVDNPAAGTNSGICGFYVFLTGSTYTSNLTSGTGGYYSGGSAINATEIDFPHSTACDLIVWARINNTDSGLDVSFTSCNITWTGNITSSTAPDHTYVTATSATFIFVNYVWDNSNAGYTATRNEKDMEIEDITLKGFK